MVDLSSKGPMGLNRLTASEAARALDSGEVTSEGLVRDCLARVEAREPDVHAWDYLDPGYALEQAKALDSTPRRSALHGVPIGIKDIFDTLDMPTAHGFAPYEGQRGDRESACVAALRAAGMVIMGKTVTTQFACPVPRKTLNPHDPTRTPGVSSSGSAAAVADFMIPLANGSQTGGSVIGPSANCGVYGYKASLDGIDRGGFRHCKPSIDTIGLFARSVEDLILLRAVQTGGDRAGSVDRHHAVRVGLARTAEWERTEPCMRAAFERAARLLESAGADVRDVDLPQRFSDIVPDFAVVNGWESAKALDYEIRNHLDAFNAHNRNRVEFVRGLSAEDYQRAVKNLDAARREMHALISDYDIFISPSLPGEAPVGINEVHTSVFARLWTQMYTPSINLPLFVGPNGLPVCLQVIGPRDSDDATLAFAAWVDGRLREALGAVPAAAA